MADRYVVTGRDEEKYDEDEDGDIEDDIDGFCHFNDGSIRDFSITLFGYEVSIIQNPIVSELGHGACVWDASIIFAKYMEYNMNDFSYSKLRGKTVLELGSGCGLGGISLMMKGADVTMTDLHLVTQQLTQINANKIYHKLISLGSCYPYTLIPPKVTSIDWTQWSNAAEDNQIIQNSYDIILLTDCVFKKSLAPDLVATIKKYTSNKTEIFCCHEIRDEDSSGAFVTEFSAFFKVKRVACDKLHPEFKNNQVVLLKGKAIRK